MSPDQGEDPAGGVIVEEEGSAAEKAAPESVDEQTRARQRWAHRRRVLIEWVAVLAVALGLAFGIRAFALQAFYIPSASMEPTLMISDRILVQKAFFSWKSLHTGDIVVFSRPPRDTMCGADESDLVKRVIALPGQSIYSVGNNIYVQGKLLSQPWLPANDPLDVPIAPKAHPYVVPQGDLYVLGDYRSVSCDSRYWGPIEGTSVVGKVILRWWHNGRPDLHFF